MNCTKIDDWHIRLWITALRVAYLDNSCIKFDEQNVQKRGILPITSTRKPLIFTTYPIGCHVIAYPTPWKERWSVLNISVNGLLNLSHKAFKIECNACIGKSLNESEWGIERWDSCYKIPCCWFRLQTRKNLYWTTLFIWGTFYRGLANLSIGSRQKIWTNVLYRNQ